jgi:hypothetical protein
LSILPFFFLISLPCYTRLNWRLCIFDVHKLQTWTYFLIKNAILSCFKKGMAQTNIFKWFQYPQIFTTNYLFKNSCHCKQICALIFHITNNFVNELVFLKQNLQLTNKIYSNSAFGISASNKPIVTCFGFQSNVKKLITSKSIKCAFAHPKVKCYCDKNYNIDIKQNKLFKYALHEIMQYLFN